MKRVFIFTFLLLLLIPVGVFAHSGYDDFFDFESYLGDDATLTKLPASGIYGTWGLNNYIASSGNDGVTSAETEKGTSLCLRRKYALYPGVYYGFKQSNAVTETLHVSFSVKISGDIPGGHGSFRFRKPNDATPYNIVSFSDDYKGKIFILGKSIKQNGVTAYYEKDTWYDVDVIYDVKSGYCRVSVADDEYLDVSYEGYSGYENDLTSISRVMFETLGTTNTEQTECRVYLDDWRINTVPRMYVQNETETFESFNFREDGTGLSKTWMLTGFLAKTDNASSYAGVFAENADDGNIALALCKNNSKPLTLYKSLKNKLIGAMELEMDITPESLNTDVIISIGDSSSYADAIRLEKNTGRLYAFGIYTGQILFAGKNYHITLGYDTSSAQGYIETSEGEYVQKSVFGLLSSPIETVTGYKILLKSDLSYPSFPVKIIFDNIALGGCGNIYNNYCEINDYSDTPLVLSDGNKITDVSLLPAELGGNKFYEYTLNAENTSSGVLKLMLKGVPDISVLEADFNLQTIISYAGDSADFDKTFPLVISAELSDTALYIKALQNDLCILSSETDISQLQLFDGVYLEFNSADTSELYCTKQIQTIKNNFDVMNCEQIGDDEYKISFSNPVDISSGLAVYVNNRFVVYEPYDAYSIKIYDSTSNDEKNISINNISDIFGNVSSLSCETTKSTDKYSYKISNPVFLSEKSGIYQKTDSISPGRLWTIFKFQKAVQ